MVKDPVCGMTIKKGDAAAMSPYQGQDYFFCMKDCQNDFLGEPAKYTGWVATSKKAHGYFVNLFSKPGKVTAGEYSRLFLELVPETGTTAKVLTVKGSMVLNFQLGDKPMKKKYDNVDMQPMKEPGFCGTRMAFLNDGYCDAKFTLQFDDGTEEQVPFRFDVLPNWDKAVGTEYGVPSKMKMAVQHHVVRKLGRFWTDVHDELGNATPDWDKALDFLGRVQAYQKYLPSFVPHKHTKETEEWRKLVDEFGASLAELRKAMEAKDAAASRTLHARIEAENCTRCHLKFRWDTHSDVTNLRDLRGKQTE
ncbi:MAG: YHS domain-containing protein [Planctomycetes bacterium]|nr:YHS domain-containing protein [Planctomycetota bacterium]